MFVFIVCTVYVLGVNVPEIVVMTVFSGCTVFHRSSEHHRPLVHSTITICGLNILPPNFVSLLSYAMFSCCKIFCIFCIEVVELRA